MSSLLTLAKTKENLGDQCLAKAEALGDNSLRHFPSQSQHFFSLLFSQQDTPLFRPFSGGSRSLPFSVVAPLAASPTNVLPVGLTACNTDGVLDRPGVRIALQLSPRRPQCSIPLTMSLAGAPLTKPVPSVGDLAGPTLNAGVVVDCPTGDLEVQRVVAVRGKECQVLDPVVEPDMVDVMNVQAGRDRSMMALPDRPMLQHTDEFPVPLNADVGVSRVWIDVPPSVSPPGMARTARTSKRTALVAVIRVAKRFPVCSLDALNGYTAALTRLGADLLWHTRIIPQISVYRIG